MLSVGSTVRRQDMPQYYRINGSIYVNLIKEIDSSTSFNDNTAYYLMEKSHSVDIDNYVDLEVFKYYLGRRENK